jgi:hypothetical protein
MERASIRSTTLEIHVMSTFNSIVTAALAALIVPCGVSRGESIAIVNAGFELQVLGNCGVGGATGWSGGNWRPGGPDTCLHSFLCGPPQGNQVAYTNGAPLTQVLTATLQSGVEYTLRVEVGRRLDCCVMVDYAVQLYAGGVLLAEDPGLLDPTPGTFETSTVTYTAPAGHPALGQPLEIRLVRVAGVQANFDDVRLDTGEPSQPTVGDIDLDGDVDGVDLAILLGTWGPCVGACCTADLNDNGIVNGIDLAILLGNWG